MGILTGLVFLVLLFQGRYTHGFILGTNVTQGSCEDATPTCDLFDICQQNVEKAKELCRKYCNLCDVIDGSWSVWGSWGRCDVTCGNGTKSRVRSCNNPAPAHGGDDCQGAKEQTSTCVVNPCPVNGGWSGWSLWGSCSSSCGIGMQRRDRTCDNPLSSKDGNPCFGDSVDNRICTDVQCPVGWNSWSGWTSCSVTCGTGLQRRYRSCQNPMTSLINDSCSGDPTQFQTCTDKACSSAFTATGYAPYGYDSIRFPSVILNEGNDYNSATGVFTCRVPGLYIVTATIGNFFGWNVDYVACYIQLNGSNKLRLYHDPQGDDLDGYTSSSTGTFRLQVNDRISVGSCSSREFIYNSTMTSFSAVLIRPDQI
ncbi:coadhesin-like [Mya arenaria]|uniref:coadhesin-like n=1 Tax=Mya arenaria TaxID=6604 RepID=UPI0022E21015|nr:coadhesin-like [Mya arenaria]